MHRLFELIWRYRFLYRDLNDLLSKNRQPGDPVPAGAEEQGARHPGAARRHGRAAARCASTRARPSRWPQHGGGADLLAQLRVRAQPARGAGARDAQGALLRGAHHCCTCWCPTSSRRPARAPASRSSRRYQRHRARRRQRRRQTHGQWTAFPSRRRLRSFDAATLKKHWARLHAGHAEPLPGRRCSTAWVLFHSGEFQKAADAGPAGTAAPA